MNDWSRHGRGRRVGAGFHVRPGPNDPADCSRHRTRRVAVKLFGLPPQPGQRLSGRGRPCLGRARVSGRWGLAFRPPQSGGRHDEARAAGRSAGVAGAARPDRSAQSPGDLHRQFRAGREVKAVLSFVHDLPLPTRRADQRPAPCFHRRGLCRLLALPDIGALLFGNRLGQGRT